MSAHTFEPAHPKDGEEKSILLAPFVVSVQIQYKILRPRAKQQSKSSPVQIVPNVNGVEYF